MIRVVLLRANLQINLLLHHFFKNCRLKHLYSLLSFLKFLHEIDLNLLIELKLFHLDWFKHLLDLHLGREILHQTLGVYLFLLGLFLGVVCKSLFAAFDLRLLLRMRLLSIACSFGVGRGFLNSIRHL